MGVDAQIGQMLVRAIHVPAPSSERYRAGADVQVVLTLVNHAVEVDVLRQASSADAAAVGIFWDQGCDGTTDRVAALPVQSVVAPTPPPVPAARPFDPYHLRLTMLRHDVAPGTRILLVLTFQLAGRLDTAAFVLPRTAGLAEPIRSCPSG